MSESGNFSLSAKDVIHIESFQGQASLFREDSTLKLQKILRQIEEIFQQSGALSADEVAALLQHGIPCEILQPGAPDWQTGVLQLKLSFQPGSAQASVAPVAASVNLQQVAQPAPVSPIVDELVDPLGTEAFAMPVSNDLSDDLSPDLADDFGMEEQLVAEIPSLDEDSFSESLMEPDFGADLMPSNESLEDDLGGLLQEDTPVEAELAGLSEERSEDLSEDLDFGFMNGAEEADPLAEVEEAAFDLDSQAVEANSLNELDSPWNLDSELDAMLLQNGNG